MAWKIERWLTDVYRQEDDLVGRYSGLSARELAIVASATLDVALAELLAQRFVDDAAETADFLGADEDGRAPASSFGARIQLAYLLGIISKRAAGALRAIKALRNVMAHRVKVSILDERAQKALEPLRTGLLDPGDMPPEVHEKVRALVSLSRTDDYAARVLVILMFSTLHEALHDTASHVVRVSEILVE